MGFILGTSQKNSEEEPYNYPIDPALKEKAYALENEFISKYCAPLTLKELYYKDIHIDYHGDTYLHTLIRGEEDLSQPNFNNKKILMLIHGYQASSFIFFRLSFFLSCIFKLKAIFLGGINESNVCSGNNFAFFSKDNFFIKFSRCSFIDSWTIFRLTLSFTADINSLSLFSCSCSLLKNER